MPTHPDPPRNAFLSEQLEQRESQAGVAVDVQVDMIDELLVAGDRRAAQRHRPVVGHRLEVHERRSLLGGNLSDDLDDLRGRPQRADVLVARFAQRAVGLGNAVERQQGSAPRIVQVGAPGSDAQRLVEQGERVCGRVGGRGGAQQFPRLRRRGRVPAVLAFERAAIPEIRGRRDQDDPRAGACGDCSIRLRLNRKCAMTPPRKASSRR